ncbi:MAG: glycosyltransferase family 39 protein, partial [Alphaproteobacteria bacterium]
MFSLAKDITLKPRAIGIGIFLLALALRLGFALQWHELPYGDAPLWDAKGHDDWAMKILQGQFLQPTAFYSSPLYPFFLALIYQLFGHSFLIVSIINAMIDSATCTMLGIIALEYFGVCAAVLTGLLAALCRSMIFYTAPVMKESLGLFLLAAFTYLFLRALRESKARDFVLGGFCLGLCAL